MHCRCGLRGCARHRSGRSRSPTPRSLGECLWQKRHQHDLTGQQRRKPEFRTRSGKQTQLYSSHAQKLRLGARLPDPPWPANVSQLSVPHTRSVGRVVSRNGSVNCRRKKNRLPSSSRFFRRSDADLFGAKPGVQRCAGRADDAENSGWAFGRVDTTVLRMRQDGDEEDRAEKCKAQKCLHD